MSQAIKLYVGNFPLEMETNEVKTLFEGQGFPVKHFAIRTEADTGKSRGFGFIEVLTAESAEAVITKMTGIPVGNRTLLVNYPFRRRDHSEGARPRVR